MALATVKEEAEKKRGKVEAADTYLGLASKLLTIAAACSTLAIWLYSTYYVGTLEIKPSKSVNSLTVKLYDERGMETVYHTDRLKVVPGRYQVILSADDREPTRCQTDVKFNGITVVPYVVQKAEAETETETEDSEISNRRWWQIWKRN